MFQGLDGTFLGELSFQEVVRGGTKSIVLEFFFTGKKALDGFTYRFGEQRYLRSVWSM
jgi:hypothetical protein